MHCHLCSDFFTFLYFGISFSSHSLHRFLTLFLDVLDLSSSILKFSFFPFNKLEEMQYITIYATHTYINRKCHIDNFSWFISLTSCSWRCWALRDSYVVLSFSILIFCSVTTDSRLPIFSNSWRISTCCPAMVPSCINKTTTSCTYN